MSLLLDALKKAALEKQRREQHSDGEQIPEQQAVHKQTIEKPAIAEQVIEENAPEYTLAIAEDLSEKINLEIEDTAHEKVDIGELNTHLLDEVELEPTFVIEPTVKTTDEHQGSELVFDIDDTDSEYIEEENSEETSPQLHVEHTPPVQEEISAIHATREEIAPVNNTSTSEAPVQISAQPAISATHPVDQFNSAAGKNALAQLLSRSRKVADNARKRMLIMYLLLAITAATILVLYYYFLFNDGSSITVQMPAQYVQPVTPSDPTLIDSTQNPTDAKNAVSDQTITNSQVTNIDATTIKPDSKAINEITNKEQVKQPVKPAVAPKANQQVKASDSNSAERASKQAVTNSQKVAASPVNSLVERGYQAYQAGDISRAEAAYHEALAQDKYDRDALLGAAAVAVRQGRQQDALNLYQQRLTREPKDEYAQAGILALGSGSESNPQLESELNRLLREYPNAAHLYFLKGSIYAEQKQWLAAQASLFEAWQRDGKNADIAYNLAIALDHLDQPKEAARFYHQALELSNNHPGFSVDSVQRRLKELESAKPTESTTP